MERMTFKILFFVQKTRVAKNGEVPVLLRVTVNGQRAVTSINLKVDPEKWNAVAGKIIGNTRKDDEVNARLDTIRMRVMQIHREMEIDREKISAQRVNKDKKSVRKLGGSVRIFICFVRRSRTPRTVTIQPIRIDLAAVPALAGAANSLSLPKLQANQEK